MNTGKIIPFPAKGAAVPKTGGHDPLPEDLLKQMRDAIDHATDFDNLPDDALGVLERAEHGE